MNCILFYIIGIYRRNNFLLLQGRDWSVAARACSSLLLIIMTLSLADTQRDNAFFLSPSSLPIPVLDSVIRDVFVLYQRLIAHKEIKLSELMTRDFLGKAFVKGKT